jgi:hypothetical protein
MKKIAANVVLTMTFVFLLTAAGYSQQPILKADVPFNFTVGKQIFPAGEYEVIRISPQTLGLRGNDNSYVTMFVTGSKEILSQSNPKLKFKTMGGQHVLAEIWPDGATRGYELHRVEPVNVIAQTPSAPEGQTATSTYAGK